MLMGAGSTGKARIERQMKASRFLTLRLSGMSLREIGAAEDRPCSAQAVCQFLQRTLSELVIEPLDQIRMLEAARLDDLLKGVWPKAIAGDIAAVDRALSIMARRAKLLGLDIQPSGWDGRNEEVDENGRPVVHVEIVNDPETKRREWLFRQTRQIAAVDRARPL